MFLPQEHVLSQSLAHGNACRIILARVIVGMRVVVAWQGRFVRTNRGRPEFLYFAKCRCFSLIDVISCALGLEGVPATPTLLRNISISRRGSELMPPWFEFCREHMQLPLQSLAKRPLRDEHDRLNGTLHLHVLLPLVSRPTPSPRPLCAPCMRALLRCSDRPLHLLGVRRDCVPP
jgi:hypothetical protein